MSRRPRRLAVALVAASALVAATATAGPSLWERARAPKQARALGLFHKAERLLLLKAAGSGDDDSIIDAATTERAIVLLELAHLAGARDARVDFLLADLLARDDCTPGHVQAPGGCTPRSDEIIRAARRGLDKDPTSPHAARAWYQIAIARAKQARRVAEIGAYTKALAVESDPSFRANVLYNRAESHMMLGRLDQALRDYRASLKLAERPDLQALIHYGMGVTLERRGDLPRALTTMAQARKLSSQLPTGSALDQPSVFFVPPYDKHYYKALEAMAIARRPAPQKLREKALKVARQQWLLYLEPARAEKHRWLPHAERLLRYVDRRLAAPKAGGRRQQR